MKNNPTILISGGGTGGHIFPAIAIGKAIEEKYPKARIEFVGAKDKMEMQKVPEAGFKIHGLWISGIQRKLTLKNLSFPFKLISSLHKSKKLIKKIDPDVVVGVGGFASGPLLIMASRMGVPTLIQEQNGYPGITNKLLSKRANKICVAFDNMERFFPSEKIVRTGNPIRKEIVGINKSKQEARKQFSLNPDKPTILIIGGSLGARTVNESIEAGLDKLKTADIQILWQTGKFYTKEPAVMGLRTQFIKDMSTAYDCADLVISRAGALSISELCAKGKATIMVPSPNVAEDHQTKNAMALVEKEAAFLIKDNVAKDELVDKAIEIIQDNELLQSLQSNISAMAVTDAASRILNEIEYLIDRDI